MYLAHNQLQLDVQRIQSNYSTVIKDQSNCSTVIKDQSNCSIVIKDQSNRSIVIKMYSTWIHFTRAKHWFRSNVCSSPLSSGCCSCQREKRRSSVRVRVGGSPHTFSLLPLFHHPFTTVPCLSGRSSRSFSPLLTCCSSVLTNHLWDRSSSAM